MDHDQEVLNELLALARTNTRNSEFFSANPREVSKEEKIKRSNNISRLSEETHCLEVSGETCLLGQAQSDILTSSISLEEKCFSQEEVVNVKSAASTSSRTLTGITAQHARTARGIKVSLNIQEATDVATGAYSKITAELKRHDRLRELKAYSGDSTAFAQHYTNTITEIKELKPEQGQKFAIGRAHARGSRSAWIANVMVLGELDEQDQLTKIYFYYNNEEYVIDFDQELSPKQKELYYCSGVYGELKRAQAAPTLQSIKKDIWK
jgi:hypothetical protein